MYTSGRSTVCVHTSVCVRRTRSNNLNLDLPGTAVDLLHAVPLFVYYPGVRESTARATKFSNLYSKMSVYSLEKTIIINIILDILIIHYT